MLEKLIPCLAYVSTSLQIPNHIRGSTHGTRPMKLFPQQHYIHTGAQASPMVSDHCSVMAKSSSHPSHGTKRKKAITPGLARPSDPAIFSPSPLQDRRSMDGLSDLPRISSINLRVFVSWRRVNCLLPDVFGQDEF